MPKVVFIDHADTRFELEVPAGRTLMQAAIDHGVPGILGDCGGVCSCATCHGFVDERWLGALPAQSETERFMLEEVPDRQPNSRLCCQIRLDDALDGIVVRLPAEQY